MFRLYFSLFLLLFVVNQGLAQCPGCITTLPDLPEDTIFISNPDPGQVGMAYDFDISFRLPKTTASVDPTINPPLPITTIEIVSVTNVPPGLQWDASQTTFQTGNGETDGCVKFCGTPLTSDSFYVNVVVDATVVVFTQTTSFVIPFYMAPAESISDGFTMTNTVGCGETTVEFTNNVASGGNEGISYFWNFGNNETSTEENPPNVTYDEPGTYNVTYEAVIDTLGYFLNGITVEATDCDDLFGDPDIYLTIFDPNGDEIFVSQTISDTPPIVFGLPSIPLEGGNYSVMVSDDDPITQVNCGSVNFNFSTEGSLFDGDLEVSLDILNPQTTVSSEGIVTVYEVPDALVISPMEVEDLCEGESIDLEVLSFGGVQWYRDTAIISNENFTTLEVTESGAYYVVYTSFDGCTSTSEEVVVNFVPVPANPFFAFSENELTLVNPQNLPDDFSLQWYLDGELLVGEIGQVICMEVSGDYTLIVTDNETDCTAEHDNFQVFFPNEGCAMSPVNNLIVNNIRIYPNPARDFIQIELPDLTIEEMSVYDMRGVAVWRGEADLRDRYSLDISSFANGVYLLKIENEGEIYRGRFVKTN
ncbi:MAG: hypothetical protein ACI85O_000893 [Saprospiraceae bacterium]|jgi:hypothetical protein